MELSTAKGPQTSTTARRSRRRRRSQCKSSDIECFGVFQAANERVEARRYESNLVVALLVDVDDRRLALRPTLPVVETEHVVASGGAVRKIHTNGRVAPLINPETAPRFST